MATPDKARQITPEERQGWRYPTERNTHKLVGHDQYEATHSSLITCACGFNWVAQGEPAPLGFVISTPVGHWGYKEGLKEGWVDGYE